MASGGDAKTPEPVRDEKKNLGFEVSEKQVRITMVFDKAQHWCVRHILQGVVVSAL